MLRVIIRGNRHLSDTARRKIASKRLRVQDELTSILRAIARSWQRRVPRRTGALSRSVRVLSFNRGRARLEITASYAAFVEKGTRPHVIEARPGGVLRWTGSDGQIHFARRVKHPGSRPGNQLRDAVAANRRTLRPRIQRVLRSN